MRRSALVWPCRRSVLGSSIRGQHQSLRYTPQPYLGWYPVRQNDVVFGCRRYQRKSRLRRKSLKAVQVQNLIQMPKTVPVIVKHCGRQVCVNPVQNCRRGVADHNITDRKAIVYVCVRKIARIPIHDDHILMLCCQLVVKLFSPPLILFAAVWPHQESNIRVSLAKPVKHSIGFGKIIIIKTMILTRNGCANQKPLSKAVDMIH